MDFLIPTEQLVDQSNVTRAKYRVYELTSDDKNYIGAAPIVDTLDEAKEILEDYTLTYGKYGRKFFIFSQVYGPIRKVS